MDNKENYYTEVDLEQNDTLKIEERYNDPLLSWLQFNGRVLNEAKRKENPIIERLNFIGIADSNLDEFIRTKFKEDAYTRKLICNMTKEIEDVYNDTLEELKTQYNIAIIHPSELRYDSVMYTELKRIFKNKLYPLIQPLLLTDELPMPDIDDGGTFIVTKLEEDNRIISGIIKLPEVELIEINIKHPVYKKVYCLNVELITEFTSVFYKGVKINWNKLFRVYRKIDSLYGQKTTDYLSSIKIQLNGRKNAKLIMYDIDSNIKCIESIVGNAKKRKRTYIYGLSYLKDIKDYIDYKNDMIYPKAKPRNPIELIRNESIFDILSNKDILVHFPYEDFKLSTVRLLEEAAVDPKVKSIRQTLYRVSKDSRLIKALITAAKNGKQVVVLLELKAKMDELHNIELTEELRSAGCNIIFGPVEIKTHAKTTLVIREEGNKLAKYCNISTGNFNESTAKIYEDFSYFCKERKKYKVGTDLLDLFNYLGGYSILDKSNELLVSPYTFRNNIEKEIDRCIEIKTNNPEKNVEIFIKCNSFTDKKICDKLYEASSVGVDIKCIIRGMCIIRPQVKGLSENINVISIVGRYLEHSRIYQFKVDNEISSYIGSGDLMPRNLDYRVEVIVPIKNKIIRDKINDILNLYYKDNTNSYKLIDSEYIIPTTNINYDSNDVSEENKTTSIIDTNFSIQQYFIDEYKRLEKSAIK